MKKSQAKNMNASTIADIVDSMDHVIEEQQKLIKILRNALLQYISIEEVERMEKETI